MGGNVQLRSHPRVKHLARDLQASFDDVGVVTTCKVDDEMAVNLHPQPLGYWYLVGGGGGLLVEHWKGACKFCGQYIILQFLLPASCLHFVLAFLRHVVGFTIFCVSYVSLLGSPGFLFPTPIIGGAVKICPSRIIADSH